MGSRTFLLTGLCVATLTPCSAGTPAAPVSQDPPPRILLDQSPRAVEYQLARLDNDQLARVERRPDDPRYVPVYQAILRRAGMPVSVREEALAALTASGTATRTGVLLDALGRIDDEAAAAPLLRLLFSEPPQALAADRARLSDAFDVADAPAPLLQGAYVAGMLADGRSEPLWSASAARPGHRAALLEGLSHLPASPAADALRRDLAPRVVALIETANNDVEKAAAVGAVASLDRSGETFRTLARVVMEVPGDQVLARALAGLAVVPEAEWAADVAEPLVGAILQWLEGMSPAARTEAAALDAIHLAGRLAGLLPSDAARPLRASLRELGVLVVRIEAIPEQVAFDRRWFVVEAGRPVQIVFFNPDAMPHNIVIGQPGSLELLGTEGGAMPMPSDPAVKPFVPDSPLVVAATRLLAQGETERLGFSAPEQPGDYIFVCTFPGHWIRMYGVMRVVPSLEAWEAAPETPLDPMTGVASEAEQR